MVRWVVMAPIGVRLQQRLHNIVALMMVALLMALGIRRLGYLAAFDRADVMVMANFARRSLAREEEGLSLTSKY